MKRWIAAVLILFIATGSYAWWSLNRPLPMLTPVLETSTTTNKTVTPALAWAPIGQQAVGVSGLGVIATHGTEKIAPMASIAKVMLAMSVLQKYPLKLNQAGPNVPVTAADVATYNQYKSTGQSVALVQEGETLSEYEALQALLLPSANNVATLLANWAFGSQANYVSYANDEAKKLGMNNTTFFDASGFSPNTASTPSDLVLMGIEAMKNPVIAQIVKQTSATIPVAGVITNYNSALGRAGINGIKTGNTDEAGGCLLFSTVFEGTTLVGAIMGTSNLATSLSAAPPIADSLLSSVQTHKVIIAGQVFAQYQVPWSKPVDATVEKEVTLVDFKGTEFALNTSTDIVGSSSKTGQKVGSVYFTYQNKKYSSDIILADNIPKPSTLWRLTHPFTK